MKTIKAIGFDWTGVMTRRNSVDQRIITLIEVLRDKGYKIGLLSNQPKGGGDYLRQQGIDKYFDSFLISGEIDLIKPDKAAFDLLAQELGVSMEELLFIDDSERILSTSAEFGYHPILFTNTDNLILELKNLDILEEDIVI